MTDPTDIVDEPEIIIFLRKQLATREGSFGVTLTTQGAWPKGTTVRPELLSENQGGGRVWRLKWWQVEKFLEAWEEATDD